MRIRVRIYGAETETVPRASVRYSFFTASCTNLSVLELFCAKPLVVDQIAQEAAV